MLQDVLRFCSFAGLLQLAIFMLYASRAGRHSHGAQSVVQHMVDLLIASVPIPIPTVLIFSLFRCVVKLKQHHIEVLQTRKIKAAAAADLCVFDKTGTLTGSLPELHGMLPVSQGTFQTLQQDAVHWPYSLKQCAAVCNSLNFVNKTRLVGDVADYDAFKSCEARFSVRRT